MLPFWTPEHYSKGQQANLNVEKLPLYLIFLVGALFFASKNMKPTKGMWLAAQVIVWWITLDVDQFYITSHVLLCVSSQSCLTLSRPTMVVECSFSEKKKIMFIKSRSPSTKCTFTYLFRLNQFNGWLCLWNLDYLQDGISVDSRLQIHRIV